MENDSSSEPNCWYAINEDGYFVTISPNLTPHQVHVRKGRCKSIWKSEAGDVFCMYPSDHHGISNKEAHQGLRGGDGEGDEDQEVVMWYTKMEFVCESVHKIDSPFGTERVRCRGGRRHVGPHAGHSHDGTEYQWMELPNDPAI